MSTLFREETKQRPCLLNTTSRPARSTWATSGRIPGPNTESTLFPTLVSSCVGPPGFPSGCSVVLGYEPHPPHAFPFVFRLSTLSFASTYVFSFRMHPPASLPTRRYLFFCIRFLPSCNLFTTPSSHHSSVYPMGSTDKPDKYQERPIQIERGVTPGYTKVASFLHCAPACCR